MAISVFDLFSIGIGPSSSHTVGPMRAARQYLLNLEQQGYLQVTHFIKVDLYGSLALTGKGHATDLAILLGLEGELPADINPDEISKRIEKIRESKKIKLLGKKEIEFDEAKQLIFHYDKQLPYHPNGMRFVTYDEEGKELFNQNFYSVGGGFIVNQEAVKKDKQLIENDHLVPYLFSTADELLRHCHANNFTIAELMMENEKSWRPQEQVKENLLKIWQVMRECVKRGCQTEGVLPGGLNVKRRAAGLLKSLTQLEKLGKRNPIEAMQWVSLWALAVNEENASGGRVVTAPTNGAAGIIPAVMHYYEKLVENSQVEGLITFMLTAGAIGILYKQGASISAAEMGCMGEVGVACSMAAAGLTAALGGTNQQIENAAEIGMEHNLGLTCDPVNGLVQIPCIERNTMGAIKAINASLLALEGDGTHIVSLDEVIATMRETGHAMHFNYKETSLGGLAQNVKNKLSVSIPEC